MTDILRIKAFAFDVDGVATDGDILCNPDGDLLRTYDAKDGFGIRMACMNGYPVAVITGGRSESILKRMLTSGIRPENVYLGSRNKIEDFMDFCFRVHVQPDEVMYFGDDVPDIEVMQACGCGVCPSDAMEDVRAIADIVSPRPGGKGCLMKNRERMLRLPALRIDPVDATGAGDHFAAGFVSEILRGASPEEALRFANACGAVCTTAVGAGTALKDREQVLGFLAADRRTE